MDDGPRTTRHNGVVYAWLRRPVPGLRVARGDLMLALALSIATLLLAEDQVGDVHHSQESHHASLIWHMQDVAVPGVPSGPGMVIHEENGPGHLAAALNLLVT